MNVLLISTYELGRQPFGLASAAATLRERGHEVVCADLAAQLLPAEAARAAGFIGLYLPMHTATRLAVPLIARLRALNPEARIGCFGLCAALNAEYLRELGAEALVGGEFEEPLAEAVERGDGRVVISTERQRFAVPDRDSLPPLAEYAHLHVNGEVKTVGYTEASRGCKHLCRHCPVVPVYRGRFRIVPPEIVLEDVRRQVAAGARHITFGDPDFLNGPGHAMRVVRALHAEHPDLTYDVTVKIEHLRAHAALLGELRATGCLLVTTAVESLDDAVLARLEKGHTRADFELVLAACRAAGLALAPTFIPFTPWTTHAGYRALLSALVEMGLVDAVAPVQLGLRLLITAESRLLELPEIRDLAGEFDPAALVHPWRHPDPTVDELSAAVLRVAADGQSAKATRCEIFAEIWRFATDDSLPENYDLMPRATIPWLDEPWYC